MLGIDAGRLDDLVFPWAPGHADLEIGIRATHRLGRCASMKVRGTLFAAGAAMLLWTASAAPAGAAVPRAAGSPLSFVNLLGGSCSPGLYFTQTSGSAVTVGSSIDCYSSVDYLQIDVQLRRSGGVVSSNSCGTTSWSV